MSVATAYAKALFESASEKVNAGELAHSLDEIEKQLNQFISMMDQSKEARVALVSPVTTVKEKAALAQSLSAKMGFSPRVIQFMTLLANKNRVSILEEIRDVFHDVRLSAEGSVSGKVVSAETMSDADIDSLAKAFGKKLGKKVSFRVSTDPTLLAGVKVTVNGVTYDGTLRSQLEQLREKFVVKAL